LKRNQRAALAAVAVGAILIFFLTRSQPEPAPDPVPVAATPEAKPTPVEVPIEKIEVLFAKKLIPRYTFLDSSNITDLLVPRKGVPKNILPNVKLARRFKDVKGYIALEDIGRDEPIVMARLARPGEVGGVSFHIQKGMRAVTVRIDKIRGVSGFINQGDRVDILGAFNVGGSPITRYILQNASILAVNSTFRNPDAVEAPPEPGATPGPAGEQDKGPKDRVIGQGVTLVTFELTPPDSEKLILASSSGARLYLSLRSPGDDEPIKSPAVDDVDLYFSKPKKPPVPKVNIYVYKGPSSKASVAAVRVDAANLEGASALDSGLNIYLDLQEAPIRDIKESDFSTTR